MNLDNLYDGLNNQIDTIDYIQLRYALTENLAINIGKQENEKQWIMIKNIEQYFLTNEDVLIKKCYENFCKQLTNYSNENKIRISYDLELSKNEKEINCYLLVEEY